MIRSQKPCRLTAGKVYIMSLANFTTVIIFSYVLLIYNIMHILLIFLFILYFRWLKHQCHTLPSCYHSNNYFVLRKVQYIYMNDKVTFFLTIKILEFSSIKLYLSNHHFLLNFDY
uniref:Olfactory receptor 144 n=1 Tax=Aulacocentrum confusum TaxID=2767324 RepID=A0A7G8Z9G3_9HYME|nr:olfactory receptor 144 [Aulacocentrum confusum]